LDLQIDIEDTGIGIKEGQLQTIFTEFTQSEHHNYQKYGGTGLGLSISRRLVQLMGGTISVTSQPGIGSTFTVSFKQVDVAAINSSSMIQQQSFDANAVQFSPAVVMVVDDIVANRDLISENLRPTALTIVEAENGKQAVEKVREQSVDLILMDLRMPEMNGYQAAEIIKSFLDIPIIALTASVMKDEHQRVKSEHFDGYLQKPVLRADLFEMLSGFLEHQMSQQTITETPMPVLSDEEKQVLPDVLQQLQRQHQQWQLIQQTNNISDIQVFANDLLEIAESNQFNPLKEYAIELNDKISVFDVSGIKQQLRDYSRLLTALEGVQEVVRE
jgi:two-component system sensor histidine kinase EvgS